MGIPRTVDGKADLSAAAPRMPDGKPDLSGMWQTNPGGYVINMAQDLDPADIQPRATAQYQHHLAEYAKDDPACFLPSGPRYYITGIPKIIQTAALIVILNDDLTYRQIFLDGRSLPKDPSPSFMGYSVGRWEGDTLVVDSFRFNDRTWLDARGLPHTDALRTTERYRRRTVGQLQVELTVSDPGAFAGSWTMAYDLRFQPDTEMLEAVCEDKTRWIGRGFDAERGAVAVPPETLAKYVGVYSGLWGDRPRTVRIQLENGILYSNGLLGEKVRLIPHSATTFMGTDGYSFDFDPEGNPAGFMVERHVSGDWKYARQPDK
jgi:hypothetical protein